VHVDLHRDVRNADEEAQREQARRRGEATQRRLLLTQQRPRLWRDRAAREILGAAPRKVVLGERPERARHARFELFIAERRISERNRVDLAVVRELHLEADPLISTL
jgi:hypothetical protein